MKKKFVLLFCLLLFQTTQYGQHEIIGLVLSEDLTPLQYALVSVYSFSDSTIINSVTTDKKGQFRFNLHSDNFNFTFQMLGYKGISQDHKIENDHDMGKVILKEEAILLQGVEISADRSRMESHLGKKVLFIGNNLGANGSSALDALEQIPSVTTNSRGQVQIRGNSSVIIFVNGKETQRKSSALKFISADVLHKIEVITNPSAKYDAEGIGGIINLVYKKNQFLQFKMEVIANLTMLTNPFFSNPSSAVNLSFNKSKLSFFCSASYDFDRYTNKTNYKRSHSFDTLRLYQNDLEFQGKGSTTEVTTGLSYEPDSNFSIGMELNYHRWNFSENTLQRNKFNYLDRPSHSFEIPNSSNEVENELWLNIAMEKKFAPQRILKLSLTTGGEEEDNDWQSGLVDYANLESTIGQFLRFSKEDESQRYFQIKADLETSFFNFGKLQTGAKLDLIDYKILQIASLLSNDSSLPDNDFEMDMQKLGLYIIQGHSFKKINYEIGLRVEQFSSLAVQQSNKYSFEQKYFRLFPSAQIDYLLNDREHTLGFAFTQRINRPDFFELNPYISYQDPLNLSTGNPALRPEIGQLYEFSYHFEFQKWTFDASLFQRITTDAIQEKILPHSNQKTVSKPVNIGRLNSTGTEILIGYRPNNRFKSEITYVTSKSNFKDAVQEITYNNKWSTKIQFRQQCLLAQNWKLNLNANYRAPSYQIQQRRHEAFYMDLIINKKFNKKNSSITVSIRDIFNSKNYNYSISISDFEVERKHKWQTRQVSLGLKWSIIDNKK